MRLMLFGTRRIIGRNDVLRENCFIDFFFFLSRWKERWTKKCSRTGFMSSFVVVKRGRVDSD